MTYDLHCNFNRSLTFFGQRTAFNCRKLAKQHTHNYEISEIHVERLLNLVTMGLGRTVTMLDHVTSQYMTTSKIRFSFSYWYFYQIRRLIKKCQWSFEVTLLKARMTFSVNVLTCCAPFSLDSISKVVNCQKVA